MLVPSVVLRWTPFSSLLGVCLSIAPEICINRAEIAFPSSLPDPPHVKPLRKITIREWIQVLRKASKLYIESWRRDISDEIDVLEGRAPQPKSATDEKKNQGSKNESSTLEDIAIAARGGMETLRPALQRLYMARASAYKDALRNFIEGYQEGIAESMGSKNPQASQRQEKDESSMNVDKKVNQSSMNAEKKVNQ